jgi:hypothetical protein
MAITAAQRPLVIVTGFTTKSEPRYGYDRDAGRRTDELVGYNTTIAPEEGAPLQVRFAKEDGPAARGAFVALLVSVQESQQYGTYLHFERHVSEADLESIAKGAFGSAKAA